MIKLIYKITLLTFIISCTAFIAKAQVGYDYSQYDVGVALGLNSFSGEASPNSTKPSVNLNITFNQTPFTNFVFEAKLGQFAGGDSTKSPGLQFTSSFYAFVFRGQLQFGEFLNYQNSQFANAMKNFYVSAGVGYLYTHVTEIARAPVNEISGLTINPVNKTQVPFIPFRLGYEFKVFNQYQQPSLKFDVGYEYDYILSDKPDGYLYSGRKDAFNEFFIGVKFAIGGGVVSYRKQIHY